MLNRLRHTVRALAAGSGRRICQFGTGAVIWPALGPSVRGGGAVLAAAVLVAVLIAGAVIGTALWAKPARRRDALAVLRAILRLKA